MANKINFEVGLNLNQSQYNQLKKQLTDLTKLTTHDLLANNEKLELDDAKQQLDSIKKSASDVKSALVNAFNVNLGTINVDKFNTALKKLDINKIYRDFNNAGIAGQTAFRNITSQVLTTNLRLKETHKFLDEMATTMANTAKWGAASSILNNMSNSIQKAWTFTKELDTSLNDIRIVTSKSADEMERFARVANNAAQNLGRSTKDYTDAALIYYQQGLEDEEAQIRANVTLKTANVTGQSTDVVSEQLTAVWNGYKVATEETEKYVDKLAAVAATTAADLEELSIGMSKVASAASIMGVDIDQLSSTLATVISVTRQAPETVGTAFKTIFARMGDISAGIDTETTLDKYTQDMYDIAGISVLDANNELRDMGEVLEEVGNKWSSMTREQQVALSQVMAGTRQYNNLLALFDNWDMYTKTLDTSKTSLGTLNEQQEIYMESTEAHLEQLGAAWERLFDSLINNKGINGLIDIFTGLINGMGNFSEAIGGGGNALLMLGSIGTKVFGKQISQGINTTIENLQKQKYNTEQLAKSIQQIESLKQTEGYSDPVVKQMIDSKQQMSQYYDLLDAKGIEQGDAIIQEIGKVNNLAQAWEVTKNEVDEYLNFLAKSHNNKMTAGIEDLDSSSRKFLKMQALLEDVEDSVKQSKNAWIDYGEAIQKFPQDEKKITKSLNNIQNAAADLVEGKGLSSSLAIDIEVAAENLEVFTKDTKKWGEVTKNNFSTSTATGLEYASLVENLRQKMNLAQDELTQKTKQTREVQEGEFNGIITKTEEYKQSIDGINEKWDEFIAPLKQTSVIQNAVQTTQALTSMASAMLTIKNIGNIIDNENLSTSEKFLQTIMALGTAIPMFVIGMLDFVKGAKALGVAIKSSATAYALESITLKIRNQLIAEGIAFEQADAAAKAMSTKITNLSTGAIWGEVAAMIAKKALMVGGVLLAIAAVAAATYGLVKAYNADADAARLAGEAANEAANNYDKVAQKAQELKDTISDYSDGIQQLKELTIGTEEYKEALEEANEKAKELIETYGLYNDYHMEDGVITFNDGALEKLQQEIDLQKQRAENIKYSTRMLADQAQLQADITTLSRNIEKGNIINKSQAFHSLGISKITDTAAVSISDKEIKGIINALNELSETEYKNVTQSDQAFQNWVQSISQGDLSLTLLSKQIGENREGFMALAKSTNDATEAQKYYISQMNKGALEQKYSNEFSAIASDVKTGQIDAARYNQIASIVNDSDIQERIKQREIELENAWQNTSSNLGGDKWTDPEAWGHEWEQAVGGVFSSTTGNLNTLVTDVLKNIGVTESQLQKVIGTAHLDSNEDLARAYAKMSGIDVSRATWKGNKFEDDAGNVLVDVDSREARMTKRAAIFNEVRQSAIREDLQSQGEQETINVIETLDKAVATARQNGQKYGTDFSQGMLNALQSGEFNLESIYDRLDPDEVTELIGKSDEEILAMMGMTSAQLEALGDMSATEFANAFRAGFENYEWDMDKALSAAMTARDEEIESLGLSKSKTEEYTESLQDYGTHIMRIAKDSEEFADSLDKDADSAVAVGLSILQMNDGIDALADGFDDWADVLKKSTKESEEYSEALNNMQDALSLVYGVEKDYISNDFVIEHLDKIKQVAQGSEEAIESLRHELTEDIIISIATYNELDQGIQNDLLNMISELEAQIPEIKVGTEIELDGEKYQDFLNTMQDIIDIAGLTADQANALFGTMGFETNFATEEKDVEQSSPNTVTETTVKGYTSGTAKGPDGEDRDWEYPILSTSTYQDGTSTHTGKMTVMAMTTGADGKTKVPQINSIVKKGTGAQNNYSSKNKGGGSPGSKKSGGSSKPDSMDKVDKTPDRYHKVDTQLTKIGNNLSKIQSQEKKLTGAALIANINNQLDQLDARLDRLREKQQIAQGEASELRDSLSGQGVKFNEDGTIANYMEIYNAKVKYVNDLINKYNSMSKDEQEKYKETVEQAKEDLDKFTEDLDRYDELVSDTIPGLGNEIQDAIDEQIELNIKKFNLEFEVRLELKNATKEWNEFKKRILDGIDEDDIYGNAAARLNNDLSNVAGENGLEASTNRVNAILAELKEMDETGKSDVYGDDRASALEDLKEAYETVNEDLTEIDQIQKDVHQAWLDTMDEINEKMADQVAMYEQMSNLIEHDMKVIELVYGEQDYDALGNYYERQHQNNLGLLDFQRQNADFWKKEMDSIVDKNSEEWKKARDNWISATNDLNATIEDSIENARNKMENAIDSIFDKFNDEITNGKGLDYLAQQWDLVNDNADDYLDTVNAAFGIRQLESKYQDAIDATDNVSSQRKLNELMEQELNALREKDKLTEYDVERANMKYEIALKQIALEEAQQTKNTMRLRRDSQGNYRYEYVADENAISKLQDELDVLENQLYNFDKDRWTEMQNQVVDAVQERQDAIKEIMMDASLSEEERAERLVEINRLYNEKIQNITDQTVTAQKNLYESGTDELEKEFGELSAEQGRIMVEEMLPQFTTGVNEMIDKFSGPGGFEDMSVQSMEHLRDVTKDYEQDLQDIQDKADVSFDNIRDNIDDTIPTTQGLIKNNEDLNKEYETQIENIKKLNEQLQEQIKNYDEITKSAREATIAAYEYWAEQQRQDAEAAAEANAGEDNGNTGGDTDGSENGNTDQPGSGAGAGNGTPDVGEYATYIGGTYYSTSSGQGSIGQRGPGKKVKITAIAQGAAFPIHVMSNDSAYGWLKKSQLSGYDTGGYTGEWAGGYGKLAMLHSKELVLNAHDTENMLNMMQIARDVIALAGPRAGVLSAGQGAGAAAGQLEQNVHIEANFPNVESASEIEEALNNLVQLASQRANRNTRG